MYVVSFQILNFFCNGIITFHLPGRIKPVIATLVKVKRKITFITPYLVHKDIAYTICMCHGHFPAKNELRYVPWAPKPWDWKVDDKICSCTLCAFVI